MLFPKTNSNSGKCSDMIVAPHDIASNIRLFIIPTAFCRSSVVDKTIFAELYNLDMSFFGSIPAQLVDKVS